MLKKLSEKGTTVPKYFLTSSGTKTASDIGQKITPAFSKSFLNVVAIDTLSKTASTATPDNIFAHVVVSQLIVCS